MTSRPPGHCSLFSVHWPNWYIIQFLLLRARNSCEHRRPLNFFTFCSFCSLLQQLRVFHIYCYGKYEFPRGGRLDKLAHSLGWQVTKIRTHTVFSKVHHHIYHRLYGEVFGKVHRHIFIIDCTVKFVARGRCAITTCEYF